MAIDKKVNERIQAENIQSTTNLLNEVNQTYDSKDLTNRLKDILDHNFSNPNTTIEIKKAANTLTENYDEELFENYLEILEIYTHRHSKSESTVKEIASATNAIGASKNTGKKPLHYFLKDIRPLKQTKEAYEKARAAQQSYIVNN